MDRHATDPNKAAPVEDLLAHPLEDRTKHRQIEVRTLQLQQRRLTFNICDRTIEISDLTIVERIEPVRVRGEVIFGPRRWVDNGLERNCLLANGGR